MTYPAIVIPDHLEVALVPSSSGLARKVNQIVDLNGGHVQSHLQMRGAGGIAKVNDLGLMSIIGNTRSLILSGEATTFEDANKRENHARVDTTLVRALGAQIVNAGPILETISAQYVANNNVSLDEISVQKIGEILKSVKLILDLSQISPLPQAETIHIEQLNDAIQSLLNVITQQPIVMQVQFLPLIQSVVETIKPVIATYDLNTAFLSEFDRVIDNITIQKIEIDQSMIPKVDAGMVLPSVVGNQSTISEEPQILVQNSPATDHDANLIPANDDNNIELPIQLDKDSQFAVDDVELHITENNEIMSVDDSAVTPIENADEFSVLPQEEEALSDIPIISEDIIPIDLGAVDIIATVIDDAPSIHLKPDLNAVIENTVSVPRSQNEIITKGTLTNSSPINPIQKSTTTDNHITPMVVSAVARFSAASPMMAPPQSKAYQNIIAPAVKPIPVQSKAEYKPVFNRRPDIRQWTQTLVNNKAAPVQQSNRNESKRIDPPSNLKPNIELKTAPAKVMQAPKGNNIQQIRNVQPALQRTPTIHPRQIVPSVIRDRIQQMPFIRQERQNFSKSIDVIRRAVQALKPNLIKIDGGANNNDPLPMRARDPSLPVARPATLLPRPKESFNPAAIPIIERIKQKAAVFHDTIRNNKAVQTACVLHGGICRCAEKFREVNGFAVSTKDPEVKVSIEEFQQDQKDQELLNHTIDKIRNHEEDKKIIAQHENDIIRAVMDLPEATTHPANIQTINTLPINQSPSNDRDPPKTSSFKALRAAQNKTPNLA